MRIFIAVDIPEEVKQRVAVLCRSLAPLRCGNPASLHLTLRFCGDMDVIGMELLSGLLAGIGTEPFRLDIAGTGAFPNASRPRVLWVGVREDGALTQLQRRIEDVCRAAGLPPEEKRFSPHLTLARLKEPHPAEVRSFLRQTDFDAGSFTVTAFHLYSSILSPKGAVHTRERSYPLD